MCITPNGQGEVSKTSKVGSIPSMHAKELLQICDKLEELRKKIKEYNSDFHKYSNQIRAIACKLDEELVIAYYKGKSK